MSTNFDLKLGSISGLSAGASSSSEASEVSSLSSDAAWPFCASMSFSLSSPESLSCDGGPGESRRRCFEGCGLIARARLVACASAPCLAPTLAFVALNFGLRANFEYDEVLDLPKLDVPDDLRGKTAGLRLLAPVLATTTGFLLPDL